MSQSDGSATLGWGGIAALFAAAVLGIVLIQGANDKAHPPSEGADWLSKQGYTDVTGGAVDAFNGCNKGEFAREYEATSRDGERGKQVVCWGLFGKHGPLFGN
jgi:hypothetical protein